MATDRHGMVWGWGRNDLSQLGFETLVNPSKLAGKVLTIQRPNRGGQRTIQLPSDNRAFVAAPKRLDGLSVADAALIDGLSVDVPTDDAVLAGLKKFGAHIDAAYTAQLCEQFGAPHLCSFVWLLVGDVTASINARATTGRSTREGAADEAAEETASQELVDFYEPFVHKIADNEQRMAAAVAFINRLPASRSLIEAAIARNLVLWAPLLVAILRTNPDELQSLPATLKLQSLRLCESQTHAKPAFVDRVEIAQDEALVADRSVVYFSACGHAVSDRKLQANVGELQTRHQLNSALPRTARLAQELYSIDTRDVAKFRRTDCTLCPNCLDVALRDLASEVAA
uniref:Uncharacterized protein n=1 Tax=Plectus sambesii TaxID=2011161 RepID=A0A914V198_9BILA